MKRLNQSGSHVLAALLVVAALAVAGFTGYKVMQARDTDDTMQTVSVEQVPDTINNAEDLQQAGTVLDDASAELDSGLDDSQLDADLNSML